MPQALRSVRRKSSRGKHGLRQIYGQTLIMLAGLLAVYQLIWSFFPDPETIDQSNALLPCIFILILGSAAYRSIQNRKASIWSPVFLIPIQSAVFFGFGPLVEVFGSAATMDYLNRSIIDMRANELLRSNFLSTLGISFVMLGMWTHMSVFPGKWKVAGNRRGQRVVTKRAPFDPLYVALAFILFGGIFRHLILMPALWGMIDVVVAGVLSSVGAIVDVGFGLLAILIARGRRSLLPFFALFWPAHVFLTVLSFAKAEILIALLFPVIGFFAGNQNIRRLTTRLIIVGIVFGVSQEWVHHGRAVVFERTQTINEADYGERVEILFDYVINNGESDLVQDERQGWWTRLNYTRVQSFAMTAYDNGRPGDTLASAWMYFIPRAIWSEKPILVSPGKAFYETVTGRNLNTFLGLSIYGDLYWQFGWNGLILGSFIIGILLSMLSWRSLNIMETEDFFRIPLVLIAFELAAISPTSFVVNGVIGQLPIYVAYSIGVSCLYLVLRSKSGSRHHIYARRGRAANFHSPAHVELAQLKR